MRFGLDAMFENQIVAVLLHRLDEELLHILLHSNTSLYVVQHTAAMKLFGVFSCKSAVRRALEVWVL